MGSINAKLVSYGRNRRGETAQVAVVTGEGPQKRSTTVHLRLGEDGQWRGGNPDKGAVARLNAAERSERGAARILDSSAAEVRELKSRIMKLKREGVEYLILHKIGKDYRRSRGELANAKMVAQVATEEAEAIRQKVERMPIFVF